MLALVNGATRSNQLTWWALRSHPPLARPGTVTERPGGVLDQRFNETHAAGSMLAAGEASICTAVSLEAAGIVAVPGELLAAGRYQRVPRGIPQQGGRRPVGSDAPGSSLRRGTAPDGRTAAGVEPSGDGRPGRGRMTPQGMSAGTEVLERTLGWECPDDSIYLLSELARRKVERVLGPGGHNGISGRTLHEELSAPGLIAGHDLGHNTR